MPTVLQITLNGLGSIPTSEWSNWDGALDGSIVSINHGGDVNTGTNPALAAVLASNNLSGNIVRRSGVSAFTQHQFTISGETITLGTASSISSNPRSQDRLSVMSAGQGTSDGYYVGGTAGFIGSDFNAQVFYFEVGTAGEVSTTQLDLGALADSPILKTHYWPTSDVAVAFTRNRTSPFNLGAQTITGTTSLTGTAATFPIPTGYQGNGIRGNTVVEPGTTEYLVSMFGQLTVHELTSTGPTVFTTRINNASPGIIPGTLTGTFPREFQTYRVAQDTFVTLYQDSGLKGKVWTIDTLGWTETVGSEFTVDLTETRDFNNVAAFTPQDNVLVAINTDGESWTIIVDGSTQSATVQTKTTGNAFPASLGTSTWYQDYNHNVTPFYPLDANRTLALWFDSQNVYSRIIRAI